MKPSRLLVKIAVLSFFILFLVGFVAYRSGAFDKWLNEKSSAIQPDQMHAMTAHDNTIAEVDSPPTTKATMPEKKTVHDTVSIPKEVIDKMIMMSGSKSGYLIPAESDTIPPKPKTVGQIKEERMMSGSKSAMIVRPKKDTPVYERVMPSSKSGRLIYPKKDTSRKN
jgi:hypothetical protein